MVLLAAAAAQAHTLCRSRSALGWVCRAEPSHIVQRGPWWQPAGLALSQDLLSASRLSKAWFPCPGYTPGWPRAASLMEVERESGTGGCEREERSRPSPCSCCVPDAGLNPPLPWIVLTPPGGTFLIICAGRGGSSLGVGGHGLCVLYTHMSR